LNIVNILTTHQEGLISKNWHLFVPPLMTLLDDSTTSVRASGLTILSEFLKKTPPRMLVQTGLSDLLEEALMPTLSFLPTLTPVAESQLLLQKAYTALLELGDIRYASEDNKPEGNRFYDRLMREGVFNGIHHCGDITLILELLLAEMSEIISRLHIYSIRHVKVCKIFSYFNKHTNVQAGYTAITFRCLGRSIRSFKPYASSTRNKDYSDHYTQLLANTFRRTSSCSDCQSTVHLLDKSN
jgi:hypothetical protein